MKNACGGLISKLNMAQERISESEDMIMQTSKGKKQREKLSRGVKPRNPRNVEL